MVALLSAFEGSNFPSVEGLPIPAWEVPGKPGQSSNPPVNCEVTSCHKHSGFKFKFHTVYHSPVLYYLFVFLCPINPLITNICAGLTGCLI